jgi:hypothetical protein
MKQQGSICHYFTFMWHPDYRHSTGTTWALFALSQDKQVQSKLREELLTVQTDNPTMDELNSLTYLDYVVREVLRVHCPVPSTIRIAMKDDILPLSKPFVDTRGNVHNGIKSASFCRIGIFC